MRAREWIRMSLLAAAVGVIGACVTAPPPPPRYVYADSAPPPDQVEVIPVSPGPGYVWTNGWWEWGPSRTYVWVPGKWDRAPHANAHWVRPQWRRSERGWYRQDGHWK